MAIKFLVDHEVDGETFKKGQVVKDRSGASEMHFVRRGLAGFWDAKRKVMTDHEDERIETAPAPKPRAFTPNVVVHDVAANQRGTPEKLV